MGSDLHCIERNAAIATTLTAIKHTQEPHILRVMKHTANYYFKWLPLVMQWNKPRG